VIEKDGQMIEAVIYETNTVYKVGDRVFIQSDPQFEGLYSVTDFVRTPALLKLFFIFMIIILMVGGEHGINSLLGLLFSFGVIFAYVLPKIMGGSDPLTTALIASVVILCVSYFLTHGINKKTFIAIIGTFGSLVITAWLATIYGSLAKITGFGSEESSFLLGNIPIASFYNLYLAGLIIGSLGVLDDITISQASIVSELALANKKLDMGELYMRAMRIGRDHISSLVNTLVLVYAGATLPLLLLFISGHTSMTELINYEPVAEEIVRTLVGSVGLVSAVPFTTLIAAYWYSDKR